MEIYINVCNFGKISKARINISNFTIFVGNNNSGKTQLMELIYAIIKKVSTLVPEIEIPMIENVDAFHVGKKEIYDLNQWINIYLKENLSKIVKEIFNTEIPIEEVTLEFEDIDREYDFYFLKENTVDYLVKKELITKEQLIKIMQADKQSYKTLLLKKDKTGKEIIEYEFTYEFLDTISTMLAKPIILAKILCDIMGAKEVLASNILFLPASRMGLILLYKYYFSNQGYTASEVIRNQYQNVKGITKPVLDFLSFLLKYDYREFVAKDNKQLLDFIFENLIDGTIQETSDMTMYSPKYGEGNIPIFIASSMVNEVVPVVKALTDSDKIDFIFYDEVETSMHPLKQIEMVKLLNRLNNHGIRLIVSTHSDTMATKINNLLLLSYADMDFEILQEALEKKGIVVEKEDFLISKNIHVYQFIDDIQGKNKVEELEFSNVPYTGYNFTLFNNSTINLFEEAKIAMGIENEN